MAIEKFGVLGTGQMGAGIAQVAAQAGMHVLMADINLDIAKKGKAGIEKILTKGVDKGKIKAEDKDQILARLERKCQVPYGGAAPLLVRGDGPSIGDSPEGQTICLQASAEEVVRAPAGEKQQRQGQKQNSF